MLRRRIVAKTVVTVKVVRCHIQTDTHVRPQINDRLKLKARKFGHGPTVVARGVDQCKQRHSNISADLCVKTRISQDLAGQCRCCRLPVATRDTHKFSLEKSGGQLDLADDLPVLAIDVTRRDRVRRNTGRNDYQIDLVEQPGWDVS